VSKPELLEHTDLTDCTDLHGFKQLNKQENDFYFSTTFNMSNPIALELLRYGANQYQSKQPRTGTRFSSNWGSKLLTSNDDVNSQKNLFFC
jgi:hypothetical protein